MDQDNIDLRDLVLEAQAELDEALQELTTELLEPLMLQAMRMKWATLPPEQKEAMQKEYPDIYENIVGMMNQ